MKRLALTLPLFVPLACASNSESDPTEGESGDGSGESASPDMARDLEIQLYNVIVGEPMAPLEGTLHRVELAPRVTALVESAQAQSIVFELDGQTVTDSDPPFVWSEDEQGPSDWSLSFGQHTLEVTAFDEPQGRGQAIGTASVEFTLSAAGMDAAHEPLSEAELADWLTTNLGSSLAIGTFESTTVPGETLPYRLYTPSNYDPNVRYPLLVYLHGRGERGTDNRPAIYNSQLFRGPQSIVGPNSQFAFPSFVLVPQCSDMPEHQEWAHWVGNSEQMPFAGLRGDGSYEQHPDPWPSARMVLELIDALQDQHSIDAGRIYLTGESMGGFGTWEFTTRWPDVFAAGVPMAGYSDPTQAERIAHIPFWIFHGSADTSNPSVGSLIMSRALEDAGGVVIYTEYDNTRHTETFDRAWTIETELLPWIFAQRQ